MGSCLPTEQTLSNWSRKLWELSPLLIAVGVTGGIGVQRLPMGTCPLTAIILYLQPGGASERCI